ncbi:MAG TPA: DinB family protein [Chitinophagaceae bacterium]|nr:DinB family protein [Chitinophagaceae bacterium]
MTIESKQLLDQLQALSIQATDSAHRFQALTDQQLNFKPEASKWSILECLDHLNQYGDYYLPEIEQQMKASRRGAAAVFKSGVLGNYFANAMRAQNGKIKTMKSPKDKEPAASGLGRQTIECFLTQQEHLQKLLLLARRKDLNKIRISISLNRYIRIRLGDTFRFYSYHIERHISQANRNIQ